MGGLLLEGAPGLGNLPGEDQACACTASPMYKNPGVKGLSSVTTNPCALNPLHSCSPTPLHAPFTARMCLFDTSIFELEVYAT